MEEGRLDLLAQVAVLYFEEGLKQDEIAAIVGKSRSMVSRMLETSRSLGLINVHVNYASKRNWSLERQFKEKYRLNAVYILNTANMIHHDLKSRMLGNLAAQCITAYLKPGIKIGIGRSRTLYRAFSIMQEITLESSTIVQMSGYIPLNNPKYDGVDLVRKLAGKLDGAYVYCPAPLIVGSEEVRESLTKEKAIKDVFNICRKLDMAVFGVGSIKNKKSSLYEGGFIDTEDITETNVEGDILGWQFNSEGKILDIPMNKRVIALSPDVIKEIPISIAVGTGSEKAGAILAGIKGKWFNTLISDDETINTILRIDS